MKRAFFYGIPCFYNPKTSELEGRGKVSDFLVGVAIPVHLLLARVCSYVASLFGMNYETGFPIHVEVEKPAS